MNTQAAFLVSLLAVTAAGCISVKTENEVKPIHITLDVNLKVDKAVDKAFAGENMSKPEGAFKEIRALLDRKVAGVNRLSLLVARDGATEDDRILIAEANARRLERLKEIARDSGVSLETVQKRSVKRFAEKVPAGCGVWLESEDGTWRQL